MLPDGAQENRSGDFLLLLAAGLSSGSILTIMVMFGNTAFVVMAMVIDLYPNDVAGETLGIKAAAGWVSLIGVLGLLCSLLLLRRATREDQAVRQRVALGAARQANDGDVVAEFDVEVGRGHVAFGIEADYGYVK